jgi:hypothetical protein
VLDKHPDGPLTDLRGVSGVPWHCSILSREGVSRIPGPIQRCYLPVEWEGDKLIADALSYKVTLDPESGAIIDCVFTK